MTALPQLALPGLAMSEEDAFCEARRRWGNAAHVQVVQKLPESFNNIRQIAPRVCEVGRLYKTATEPGDWGYPRPTDDWRLEGQGDTWEAAFADADRGARWRGGL